MRTHFHIPSGFFKPAPIRTLFLIGITLLWMAHPCEAAKSSTPKPLKPIRQTVKRKEFTIDTVGDKKQEKDSETIRIIIRVKGEDKKPVKPREIVLVRPDGEVVEAEDRDDCKTGNEENSGLPLTVSPSVNSGGGGGVGIGINLNKLFGGGGTYSYTKIEFLRKDFVSGMKLKIILPEDKEAVIPLSSIAEPAS